MKKLFLLLLITMLIGGNVAFSQIYMNTFSVPNPTPNPLDGFEIDYNLFGSNLLASAQIQFYLSNSPDGSTGAVLLADFQILLNGTGSGVYLPPANLPPAYISSTNMPQNTRDYLEAICLNNDVPWYILGRVDYTPVWAEQVNFVEELPDYEIDNGYLNKASLQPNEVTELYFDLSSSCAITTPSQLLVYLTDSNMQILGYYYTINVNSWYGTSEAGPYPVYIPSSLPSGIYYIGVMADVTNTVNEDNESNNTLYLPVQLTGSSRLRTDNALTLGLPKLQKEMGSEPLIASLELSEVFKSEHKMESLAAPADYSVEEGFSIVQRSGNLEIDLSADQCTGSNIQIFDHMGKLIAQQVNVSGKVTFSGISSPNSFYIIKATCGDDVLTKKIYFK